MEEEEEEQQQQQQQLELGFKTYIKLNNKLHGVRGGGRVFL
jgi:hypothetical protein